MGVRDVIEGKRQWRAHMARVKALPLDYQIVYKEIQRYFFKVGMIDLPDGPLLSGIVDFFEEGVADGKGVVELIGNDIAAFCDDLNKEQPRTTHSRMMTERARDSGADTGCARAGPTTGRPS
jgi:DNA-binding ferritin-like protein (Dps family)